MAALIPQLESLGRPVEVLESDAVRRVLTPTPTYSRKERDLFCRVLALMGARLAAHGVTVECPLELCMQRDYKGMYQRGRCGESSTVPGLQDPYEAPLRPELTIDATTTSASEAAGKVLALVTAKFVGK